MTREEKIAVLAELRAKAAVGHQRTESLLLQKAHRLSGILRIFRFCFGSSGIASKKSEGIGIQFHGCPDHGGISI